MSTDTVVPEADLRSKPRLTTQIRHSSQKFLLPCALSNKKDLCFQSAYCGVKQFLLLRYSSFVLARAQAKIHVSSTQRELSLRLVRHAYASKGVSHRQHSIILCSFAYNFISSIHHFYGIASSSSSLRVPIIEDTSPPTLLGLYACGSNIWNVNSCRVEYRALESWN